MALTLEEQFAPVASTLEAIASRRNLLIQKYRHDQPVWDLCFSHPQGGQGKVEVHRHPDSNFMVTGVWWIDDYDSATRRIKWAERTTVAADEASIRKVVERSIDEMLSWQRGQWTREIGDYQKIWHRYSKAQFEAMTPAWPVPR
jgi:hypothetical protein